MPLLRSRRHAITLLTERQVARVNGGGGARSISPTRLDGLRCPRHACCCLCRQPQPQPCSVPVHLTGFSPHLGSREPERGGRSRPREGKRILESYIKLCAWRWLEHCFGVAYLLRLARLGSALLCSALLPWLSWWWKGEEVAAMAGGMAAALGVKKERAAEYKGRMTWYVGMTCLVAAVGGAIFGYDIGISGGVTSMDPFLEKFFPVVFRRKNSGSKNNYCKYDNQGLASFTSSLYLAGLVATIAASPVTRNYGRRASIVCGGVSFLIGATLNAAAVNLAMLILGRIMLGVGIGFGNQAVPLYLSEMAPAHLRGGLNMMFQLATTLGIFTANLINYGTQNLKPWGWRLSLGLAAVPALLMTVGGLLLPETPNSLIERGQVEEGRRVLERIRGTADVDAEFTDMVEASELANTIEHPFRNILERRNRPQLVMAVCMPAFQILTGINSILFYAPVLFQSMGFGSDASLYSSVLTGAVLFSSTLISIGTVDRLGRRKLLISGGIQMIVCQVIVAVILGVKFGTDKQLSRSFSIAVVVVICLFVLAFGWSWGPLGWTVPSEIFPLETRSAGQSITVAVNLLFTFAIAQAFLSLLCAFKFGIFLFFAGWITLMTAFVYVFLPETKGVPIEEMVLLWRKHWFWKKVMPDMPLEDGWGAPDGAAPASHSHK